MEAYIQSAVVLSKMPDTHNLMEIKLWVPKTFNEFGNYRLVFTNDREKEAGKNFVVDIEPLD